MRNLIKCELLMLLWSRQTKVAVIIFGIIFLSHTIECYFTIPYLNWSESLFISGSSIGHTQSILLLWFLPIHLLLQYSLKTYDELATNYHNIMLLSVNKTRIISSKLVTAFLYGALLFLFFNTIDIILSLLIHQDGSSMYDVDSTMKSSWPFMYYKHKLPALAVFIYSISTAIYFGLVTMMCSSLCLIIKDFKIILATSAVINLVFWSSKIYRVNKITQPFVEGTLAGYLFHSIITYVTCILIVSICCYLFMKRADYV